MSLAARTGRHRQRYEGQLRLVSGCIPYRLEKNVDEQNCDEESRIRILMISTPNREDLVFPKGGWEDDETIYEAAQREAFEEAGIKGILDENALGVWDFRSKSRQNSCSLEGGCRGYMFALQVTEEFDLWPEQASHKRKWLTAEEAFKYCRYEWMKEALQKLLTALSNKIICENVEKLVKLPVQLSSSTRQPEVQIVSIGCSKSPSVVKKSEPSNAKCIVQGCSSGPEQRISLVVSLCSNPSCNEILVDT